MPHNPVGGNYKTAAKGNNTAHTIQKRITV